MKTNKNIHILTTDKSSRLFITDGKLFNYHKPQQGDGIKIINQNIYITSDKKPKNGGWYCSPNGITSKHNGIEMLPDNWNEVILTTDQDLIKDGVQAIDDEFLDWFVKNPNCEFVEVYEVEGKLFAEPTIPQEESKQIKCYCGHTITCDCEPLEECKQETIEEFIKEVLESETFPNIAEYKKAERLITIGAKWQSERMYSEEEVIQLLQKALTHQDDREIGDLVTAQGELRPPNFYSWFEKFKKR